MRFLILIGLLALAPFHEVQAQTVIRSDAPLWTNTEEIWPRHFSDEESFGCISRIQFGQYDFTRDESDQHGTKWEIANYGVVHCAYLVDRDVRPDGARLDGAEPAWIVDLGEVTVEGELHEVMALQIGAMGGSEYVLLSRSPRRPNRVLVLDPTCPRSLWRNLPSVDLWRSSYCRVTNQRALRQMAIAAAQSTPMGFLTTASPDVAAEAGLDRPNAPGRCGSR